MDAYGGWVLGLRGWSTGQTVARSLIPCVTLGSDNIAMGLGFLIYGIGIIGPYLPGLFEN